MVRKKNTDAFAKKYPASNYNKWYVKYDLDVDDTVSLNSFLLAEGAIAPSTPDTTLLGHEIFGDFLTRVRAWLSSSIDDIMPRLPENIEGVRWLVFHNTRNRWIGDDHDSISLEVSGFVPKTPAQKKKYLASAVKRRQKLEKLRSEKEKRERKKLAALKKKYEDA